MSAVYTWSCITREAEFAPRDGAGALSFKGKMWLLGGWNPQDKKHFPHICNSEVWSSPDGFEWTLEVGDAPWEGRHTAGYVVHRDRMWIVGGDCNQGHYQNDVWASEDGVHWDCITDSVPWAPRALHHTAVFRDRIWVMGGQTMGGFVEDADDCFYRDIWCSEDGRAWDRVTPDEPYWCARGMIGGSAVLNGRLWILGGGTYDTPRRRDRNYYNSVWSSADGVLWTSHTPHASWAARQYHDVAVWDGKLWVMEGFSGANRNDVWFSSDGNSWQELTGTPWAPRHAASVFVHDGALWMVAGNNMTPDVWKLERKESDHDG